MALSAEEMAPLAESQKAIWGFMLAFADSMAIKAAIELRVPDIVLAHDGPISLSQIASSIASPTNFPNTDYLFRIMRYLVNKKIFSATVDDVSGETLYSPTPLTIWISNDFEQSLAPMVLFLNHPLQQAGWHCFSKCVKEGGDAFTTAHGCGAWEFASKNGVYNKLFNDGMACTSNLSMFIVAQYEGLKTMRSVVNVGGGTGELLAAIVEEYPHIKAINFDLPHVIEMAPELPGVTHVGGDMFESIPNAENILLKWIMHDWPDKECIQILKNCRKAIPENGKVVIGDIVLQQLDKDGSYCDVGLKADLLMFASTGGKERTEQEWKNILMEGGFTRYTIIPAILSTCIIEAYP